MKLAIVLLFLSFCLTGCLNNKGNQKNSENNNFNNNNIDSNFEAVRLSSLPEEEIDIASFSTIIYTKENSRQNNISIACNKLNNTIVKSRRNFFLL